MSKLYFTSLLLLFAVSTYAQEVEDLPSEMVEVIKKFRPNTTDAQAIKMQPEQVSNDSNGSIVINYQNVDATLNVDYPEPVIKPLSYEENMQRSYKNGYVKAGYGNLETLMLESQIHYDIKDWFQTGLSFKHISMQDSNDVLQQDLDHTFGDLYASYFFNKNSKITLDANYSLENRSYCCNPIELVEQAPRTGIEKYGMGAHWDLNTFAKNGFSTKQNLSVSKLANKFHDVQEWNYLYQSNINKSLGKKWFVNMDLSGNAISNSSLDSTAYHFAANPTIRFQTSKRWQVTAGAYVSNADSLWLRPTLSADYFLKNMDWRFQAYYTPNSQLNSYHELYASMPYYEPAISESRTYYREEKMGVRVNFVKKGLDVYTGLEFSILRNQANFLFSERGQFIADYYDYLRYTAQIGGSYRLNKIFSFESDFNFNLFRRNENAFIPYTQPAIQGSVKIKQELFDNLVIYQKLYHEGLRYYGRTFEHDLSLDAVWDIGAGASYLFKEKLGIFVEANNLLNNSYERFYNYHSFGINFYGGLQYAF